MTERSIPAMQFNIMNRKPALFVVLFLMTVLFFSSCATESVHSDEPLKNLVPDAGQTADTPLNDTELSADIIISIEKPDILGDDDENDESTSDTDLPVGEDDPEIEDFEGSGTEVEEEEDGEDTPSSDSTETTEPEKPTEPVLPEEEEEDSSSAFAPDIPDGSDSGDTRYVFYDVPLPELKQIYVIETAEEFGIPPELIFGVMYVETRYTETAISSNGKYIGIMQIAKSNLKTLTKKFGITDLQDFNQNVIAGAYFLSYFYEKYDGDIDKVLMCYHCGEGGAHVRWRNGVTQDGYCRKVRKEIDRILLAMDPADISGKLTG